ncbi:hypothetical protein LEP1GSC036_1771 [Leptospira weilii str. 2006001853]|uniref:Uncharacterized protein n=4 Tax=Leptospira weilii TaxID=28184 RepID=A0A828Z4N3_9LEPT|nr:hypothetical protein LEP1GSC036_1771 [Leptospira weilii str. 2006001853]EMJ64905.1 hypothetical protein LEP1GSC051_4383 [Leptospira sp. P2653]EMM71532.1 hypothetical protein LEP1GSC038_0500 [Leptospira weilii str. 2006001855]EMN42852.1 hypothetical protein LEP1GSC086_1948 [Leptospira weilii str. LNT 1234]EMN91609.1 hypothetical protein LEP1GSC108_4093 [Leptospira weilii str. UI 13098]EMY13590.1 hypothetical protein LEP1GSC043_4736 [Leptospira weilii str. Ecochallenge]
MIQIQEMNLVTNDRDFFKESSGIEDTHFVFSISKPNYHLNP